MDDHGHDHDHDHHGSELSDMQVRVRALESILVEKGYVESAALDQIVEAYETKIGPHIGARLVARAWVDPAFKTALLVDVGAAAETIGIKDVGDHVVAVENTDEVHNVVVCTLCSCYPWSVLGLPPTWYKSAPYRSRTVKDPRSVLAEFGTQIPADKPIRVWDSTSEVRFIVLPQRPAGTENLAEDALAALVSRDAMIGVALAGASA
jgi:nitrile hydratase